MAFMFENLQVYQKAVDLSDHVAALTENFSRGYYFLVDQLNRAALSVTTNLAEGNGRFTKPDRRNFFIIARGSTQECVPPLEFSQHCRFGLGKEPYDSGVVHTPQISNNNHKVHSVSSGLITPIGPLFRTCV